MAKIPCFQISFIFFLLFIFFSHSWFGLLKPGIIFSPAPWLTSKDPVHHKLGWVSETQTRKSTDYSTETPSHPLDPLTMPEINLVRTILSSYDPFSFSFPSIRSLSLHEPDKSLVFAWRKGDPLPPRKAAVIALLDGHSHILSVDLDSVRVTTHDIDPSSGYPLVTMEEINEAVRITLSHAEFNKTVLERGVGLSDLACLGLSPGWYGPGEEGRRVMKVQCFSKENTNNFYMRPIEGLTVTVDLDSKKIVKISNTGRNIPIPKANDTDYRYNFQNKPPQMDPLQPISMEQPNGPSFVVEDGHVIKWANWEFHLKADQRTGMVISRARVRDSENGELRSVVYKGFASELFVPYMDRDESWYFKTYMDAGEFGLGEVASSLVPLNDCPRNSYYMDGVFVSLDGKPYIQPNMICVFERYAGEIGWRHSEVYQPGLKVCRWKFR